MHLSQSVVLWQGRGGIQKIALFGKTSSQGKNSSNKQSQTTVHPYFKTRRSVNPKISRTLKVSSSAVAKTIKRYDKTGSHEDRHRKGRPRVTSAAEDKLIRVTSLKNGQLTAPQIADQINASQSSSNRHININCSVWISLHGQIAGKKPLLKDSSKKWLVGAKKHKQ